MSKRLMKYNPAFLTEEELIQSFVARQIDFDLILEVIRNNIAKSNQHVLIIGARGSGKTTLILRIAAAVRNDPELSKEWYPITFAEESYEVSSVGEFWLEALFHLGEQTKDERWKRTYEEIREEKDDRRLRERAVGQLMDFSDIQGKRLLILVENFNMLFEQDQISETDAWDLRHILLNEQRIMMLATATSRFESIENMDQALFELFKIHELKPLDEDECRAVWKNITGFELVDDRIRPIQILTGGNPRLLTIISTFAAKLSFKELMDDLIHLVDDHTEFFKGHLDNLPAIERKVYLALSEIWDPATAREVARSARIDVNKTSSLLNRLVRRGAVVFVSESKRMKRYQVAERMYNIYHLMRRRGGPSNRVKAVVNFMVNFYGQEDPVNVTRLIVEEACRLDPELCRDHYVYYDAILHEVKSQDLLDKIISSTPQSFFDSPNAPFLKSDLMKSRILVQGSLFEGSRGERERKREPIPTERIERKDQDKIQKLLEQADTLSQQPDKLTEAEQIYREAIRLDPENTRSWSGLGDLLQKSEGRLEEAEQAFRRVIEINANSDWGWVDLGFLLSGQTGRFEESEIAFRKAIEVNDNNEWAWIRLGQLLQENKERVEEAEQAFRKATEINTNYNWGWVELGSFLKDYAERYEEAETAYRKAIELQPEVAFGWGRLGQLLHEQMGRYEEAEAAYRKAIEIEPDYAWAWGQLGQLLHEQMGRYEEAEAAYRKAVEIKPDYAWAWGRLGQLLHEQMGRYEEAEAAYRKAIEIRPEVSLGWRLLGKLLIQSEKYNEAYKAFISALEMKPQSFSVRLDLVTLLLGKLNRPAEALALSNDFLNTHDKNSVPYNSFARTFFTYGDRNLLDYAESWARKAVALDPENTAYHHTLACILAVMNRGQEALEPAQKYLDNAESLERSVADAIELFIRLAAGGCAREALKMLENSHSAQLLEPLLVGLRLFIGEDVKAAVEIMEVARDVVKRIKERQQRLME